MRKFGIQFGGQSCAFGVYLLIPRTIDDLRTKYLLKNNRKSELTGKYTVDMSYGRSDDVWTSEFETIHRSYQAVD